MWFRMPGSSSGSTESVNATAGAANGNAIATKIQEPSKFEKFRRASFRRKSTDPSKASTRKRSKSPHAILKNSKEHSIDEPTTEIVAEKKTKALCADDENAVETVGKVYTSELTLNLSGVPLSDLQKTAAPTKKLSAIKAIKTDPPKRKFYKNFSTKRQLSHEAPPVVFGNIRPLQSIEDDDEDEEEEENSSNDSVSSSDEDGTLQTKKKEKILLTDPKFKNNRIEKSASKSKIAELEKRESIKRSRSARKLAAAELKKNNKQKKSADSETTAASLAEKTSAATAAGGVDAGSANQKTHSRVHSNLNLQALVKFVVSNKRFLSSDDFTLLRRKSITEAATHVMAVAATCKPMPIALKYTTEDVVANAVDDSIDDKTERNVVLLKKENLKSSFCDKMNENNNNVRAKQTKKDKILKDKSAKTDSSKVQRNGSNSSKSSGNFEDEAFYSCDEQEIERLNRLAETEAEAEAGTETVHAAEKQRKTSSPSLTSRVAAKINETTNNYKNRRAAYKSAKKRKTIATNAAVKRPEYYKQISAERLHSSSIVRQPSDRRADATNVSVTRSNGNASHNASDLQGSFHATTAGDSIGGINVSATDAQLTGSALGTAALGASGTTAAAAALAAGDLNAQDVVVDGKKGTRRERLQQQSQQNKNGSVSVNRSESYKERLSHKRNRNSRRKTSDPSLTSRPNDDQSDAGLNNSNYTASSNSSLSSGGGSESPSTSMEQVAAGVGGPNAAMTTQSHHAAHHGGLHHHSQSMHGSHHGAHHHHGHQLFGQHDSFHGSLSGSANAAFWGNLGVGIGARNYESDEDDDLNEVDWSSKVAADVLAALTDAEKKRQEIINEIYQTERSHVRTLKLLERLFFYPLLDSGVLKQDELMLLFPPSLSSLQELHGAFEQKLKARRLENNHVVNNVGDMLSSMFDGQAGELLREYAAQFCARQQIALESLKEKRRKDEQLQKLLLKAESHKACRRLQLKDLLPTVLQRLTKYPLLFENLYKVTLRVVPDDTKEAEAIQRALESSKKILVDVNQAVKTAEDMHKLQNIQRKLDKSNFDKDEFKNLDLTIHRLKHDGSLTLKKNPSIQLHGLLFETMFVLLTKQDDKYSLKYLHAVPRNAEVYKPVSPIMNIDAETLVRQEAADKNSFFLIKTNTSQMLELRAPSSSECKTWFKHISDAAEQYKPRSKNANQESVDDPAITTIPHSSTKESLELTPERPPPLSATATVSTTPLAPMLPLASITATVTQSSTGNNNSNNVQYRNGGSNNVTLSNDSSRMSQNELSATNAAAGAVNRTMSTRSCGDTQNTYANDVAFVNGGNNAAAAAGVTLRHTQSARQANADASVAQTAGNRNSTSIVYSNNSNDTRTLMQSSPPLVEPTAIQISISPAHVAEPVLTPTEQLRRLDASIRDGLLEKQKIICDMFRLPVEHFHEIVDIAGMPEAPKDSADIALAAYAQVQSLTEVLNEYLLVTPEQEVVATSTASLCDHCNVKQKQRSTSSNSSVATSSTQVAVSRSQSPPPPPLPPPNRQTAQAQQQTPAPAVTKLQTHALEEANIHEDDDGYCEIDELRLPALPAMSKEAATAKAAAATSTTTTTTATTTLPSELVKRQSTLSADSIPEESADEVSQALVEEEHLKIEQDTTAAAKEEEEVAVFDSNTACLDSESPEAAAVLAQAVESAAVADCLETAEPQQAQPQQETNAKTAEVTDALDTLSSISKQIDDAIVVSTCKVDNSTQTINALSSNSSNSLRTSSIATSNCGGSISPTPSQCSSTRTLHHLSALEPSVPCYALNSIVSTLNAQISLLLPKINERDLERERLRKENQHLRDLLNDLHKRQRVEGKLETPLEIKISEVSPDADEEELDGFSTTSTTPTPTPTPVPPTTAAIATEAATDAAAATTTTTIATTDAEPINSN